MDMFRYFKNPFTGLLTTGAKIKFGLEVHCVELISRQHVTKQGVCCSSPCHTGGGRSHGASPSGLPVHVTMGVSHCSISPRAHKSKPEAYLSLCGFPS